MKRNKKWIFLIVVTILVVLISGCSEKSNYEQGLHLFETADMTWYKYKDAIDFFTLAIEEQDHVEESYYYRAYCYLADQDLENAQADFESLLEINPSRNDVQEMIEVYFPIYQKLYEAEYVGDYEDIADELGPIIDERSILPLAYSCEHDVKRQYIIPLFGQINTEQSRKFIRRMFQYEVSSREKMIFMDIIYYSRDEEGISLMIDAMEDNNDAVRNQAIIQLGNWEVQKALRPMKKILNAELKKDDGDLYLISILNEAIDQIVN